MTTINFNFDIAPEDEEQLALALGCTPDQIGTILATHAKAALSEYVEAYLGRRGFTRGSDILEHRLALLIRDVFVNRLPTEREVALLFQTSPSGSRTLLRNTLSKYRYMLRDQTRGTAKSVLEAASWAPDGKAVHLKILSQNLVEALNERLRETDPTKKSVTRLTDSVATYETTSSAYSLLCKEFGATEVAKP